MNHLAERRGVSSGYLSDVSRGRRNMGVKVQRRVEALLQAPAQAAPAQRATVDPRALWDRMDAHGISQNEAARRAGHQRRPPLPGHVRPAHSVGGRAEAAARRSVHTLAGGTGHARGA